MPKERRLTRTTRMPSAVVSRSAVTPGTWMATTVTSWPPSTSDRASLVTRASYSKEFFTNMQTFTTPPAGGRRAGRPRASGWSAGWPTTLILPEYPQDRTAAASASAATATKRQVPRKAAHSAAGPVAGGSAEDRPFQSGGVGGAHPVEGGGVEHRPAAEDQGGGRGSGERSGPREPGRPGPHGSGRRRSGPAPGGRPARPAGGARRGPGGRAGLAARGPAGRRPRCGRAREPPGRRRPGTTPVGGGRVTRASSRWRSQDRACTRRQASARSAASGSTLAHSRRRTRAKAGRPAVPQAASPEMVSRPA